MAFMGHAVLANYLAQVISGLGGTSEDLGTALLIRTLGEIPMLFCFSRLIKRFGSANLLLMSGIFLSLRVFLVFLGKSIFFVTAVQVLQIVSYTIYAPGMVYYANSVTEEENRVNSQAMVGISTCIGGSLAALCGGILIDLTSVGGALLFAAIVAAVGTVIMFLTVERKE